MQLETSVRLPALAMQLSNLVKAPVLRAAQVPTCTLRSIAMIRARTLQMTPARAWPGLVAPLILPRVSAMSPMIRPTSPATSASGSRRREAAATRLATPMTSAATPSPFRGRARGGGEGGCEAYEGCAALIRQLLSETPSRRLYVWGAQTLM